MSAVVVPAEGALLQQESNKNNQQQRAEDESSLLSAVEAAAAFADTAPETPGFVFRPIQQSDRDQVKTLHEQWFPVIYQDEFYDDLVQERLAGKKLYTCVAVADKDGIDDEEALLSSDGQGNSSNSNNNIAACVVGSYISSTKMSRRMQALLMPDKGRFKRLFYIMTLGTVTEYRNAGLGSALVKWVEALVQEDSACGGVYLHVITYNDTAIRFYERLGFYRVEEIPDYYDIDGKKYASYLYAKYFNGNRGHRDVLRVFGRALLSFLRHLTYWIPNGGERSGSDNKNHFRR